VNIPPRHGKSQLVSIYFPAWFIGKYPNKKVLMVSHTADLATDFGRKVRNIIDTEAYRKIFPTVTLAQDSKSAGRWNTNVGGEYYACGVGSALAGRGADLLLVDDPHNEQDIINGNFDVFDKAYEWFTYGARTRLMPGGRVAIIQTRWHLSDLTGRVTRDMAQNAEADQYEVVEFPAVFEGKDGSQRALWPEFYDVPALMRTKASMPLFQWNAQYQQNPTAEEASVVKREWWNEWTKEDPPECEYVIMSLDAAAETNNRADYTALTTWGVFMNEESTGPGANTYNIILLNSIKKRVEFPELKKLALEEYQEWEPDAFIVEKKSSGTALYQEMRRMGLPVQEYTPHRGSGDKLARLNSVADIVQSGLCWVPQTRWAEEVVEEIAGFPFMSNDDLVDSTVMALMRFRQGGFIRLPTDEKDEIRYFKSPRRAGYY
jgi:predicted phage terminase large subunit-like protein